MTKHIDDDNSCKIEAASFTRYRSRIPDIADAIITSCHDRECFTHIDYDPIPSEGYVVDIIDKLREVLFPGYFSR